MHPTINFNVSEAGTYTAKGYVTDNESCSTNMESSATITIKNAVVTTSPELNNIHPYEVVTLIATNKEDVIWAITEAPENVEIGKNAYFPRGNTGKTVTFKGTVGNGYKITATADDCVTEVNL